MPTVGTERAAQVGSVRMLTPSIWIRSVAWLTNVTAISPSQTRPAGAAPRGVLVKSGQGPRFVVRCLFAQDPISWTTGSGWLKRVPSKAAL